MKKKLLFFVSTCFVLLSHAQNITTATNGLNKPTTTSVGLGGTLSNAPTTIDFGSSNTLSTFLIAKSTSNYLFINNSGAIGIGNNSPTEKLHLTGNFRFSGALMPNNLPGSPGQILLSGGSGASPTWFSNGNAGGLLVSGGANTAPSWLANGTAGNLLVSGGTNFAPGWLANGSAGQVLTSTGTGQAWVTPASAVTNIANADLTANANRITNFTGYRLWLKGGTNTTMAASPANTFWFGAYNSHAPTISGTIPAHQDNAVVNITTDKTWGNENGQALAISVSNAGERNGFVFYNYSNVQSSIIPTLATYSNSARTNGDAGYSHFVTAKDVATPYPMIEWVTQEFSQNAVTQRPLWALRNGTQVKIRLDNSGSFNLFATGTTSYSANSNIQLNPNGDSYFKGGGLQFQGPLLPNNLAGASGQVLTSAGPGAIPTWTTPAFGTVNGSETIVTAGTNVTVTGNGTSLTPYVISSSGTGGTAYWAASGIGTGNVVNSNTGAIIIGTGITTLPAGYKLYVSDGILAEKVKVALKSGVNWADHVFGNNYHLRSLKEVELFINENKHLPGVPSADELVKDGGIDVNTMMAKQMEKIEELTLYIIEMNKKIEKLEKENATFKSKKNNAHK